MICVYRIYQHLHCSWCWNCQSEIVFNVAYLFLFQLFFSLMAYMLVNNNKSLIMDHCMLYNITHASVFFSIPSTAYAACVWELCRWVDKNRIQAMRYWVITTPGGAQRVRTNIMNTRAEISANDFIHKFVGLPMPTSDIGAASVEDIWDVLDL